MTSDSKRFPPEQWEELLDQSIKSIRQLATFKGGEYAGDDDRLANFRRNAESQGISMELVWSIYAGKHWDALQQYIRDIQSGRERQRAEPIEGRVDDLSVYLLLLKAMIVERKPSVDRSQPAQITRLDSIRAQNDSRLVVCATDEHVWHRADRFSDSCIRCGAMRDHRRR